MKIVQYTPKKMLALFFFTLVVIMLAAEILATKTAAIRTNFAAESVSQILAK